MSWKSDLLRQSATHRILPIEIWGETLVVIPKGDPSGFGESEFSHEKQRIESLVQNEHIRNVVFDLRNAGYFGNEMTAVIVNLAEKCRAAEKTCGLCHVSDAMQVPLRTLRDNPACEWYANRRQAERDLVRLSASERGKRLFRRREFRLFLMLVFVCLIAWWVTTLRTRQAELLDHVDRLEKMIRQYRTIRDFGNIDGETESMRSDFAAEIEAILKDIDDDQSEAADHIRAASANLISLFGSPWQGTGDQVRWERDAEKHLQTAYRLLTAHPGDGVPDE